MIAPLKDIGRRARERRTLAEILERQQATQLRVLELAARAKP